MLSSAHQPDSNLNIFFFITGLTCPMDGAG